MVASLEELAAQSDLVQENVAEALEVKREVLSRIDAVLHPSKLILSSSGGVPPSTLQSFCAHPERVLLGQAQWYLGGWVGMSNRATDRSPISNLKVGDVGKGKRQQRGGIRVGLKLRLCHCRTDPHFLGTDLNRREGFAARDVNQQRGLRKPHVQHSHQRLTASKNPGTFAEAVQKLRRSFSAVGTDIVEQWWFHFVTPRRISRRRHHETVASPSPEACRPSDSKS